jgi:hypothetical protein
MSCAPSGDLLHHHPVDDRRVDLHGCRRGGAVQRHTACQQRAAERGRTLQELAAIK